MCQVLEITYSVFGISGDWTIQVPGVNYDGTYYEYYFNTQDGGSVVSEWRIIRNAGVPEWELQRLVGGVTWTPLETAPDGECPTGPWTTGTTNLITISSVTEYVLADDCSAWYSWPANTGLSSACGYWDSAIHQVDSKLEELLHVGQFLKYYTELFGESAEDTGSFQDEFQGVRVLALVYLLSDNSISFTKCNGGTFIGVLLQDSDNKLIRYELCTRLNFLVLGVFDTVVTWEGEIINCRKAYRFTSDWSGPNIDYLLSWGEAPAEVSAPAGTECWTLYDVTTPGTAFPSGVLFEDTQCPEGLFLTEFGGPDSRFSFTDETPIETGIICLCPLPEEDNCYDLLVWDKQCEFAKCTSTYLNHLLFGSYDNKELENLKEQRRILEILNCYDSRDIEDNTTIYNNFTYSKIKKLLS